MSTNNEELLEVVNSLGSRVGNIQSDVGRIEKKLDEILKLLKENGASK